MTSIPTWLYWFIVVVPWLSIATNGYFTWVVIRGWLRVIEQRDARIKELEERIR